MTDTDSESIEVELDEQSAVNPSLLPNPETLTFGPHGSSEAPDLKFDSVRLRVGRRPIARNLRTLYNQTGQATAPSPPINRAHDIWVLTYSVGLLGRPDVRQLGFSVRFPERPRVTIAQVFPETRFVQQVEGKLRGEAAIDLTGAAHLPAFSVGDSGTAGVHAEAGASASISAGIACNLSFALMSSVIQATGYGDFVGEWRFMKEGKRPLLGDQLMAHVLLAPKGIDLIKFDVQVSAVVKTSWWDDAPAMLRSAWIPLRCNLPEDESGLGSAGLTSP
jgi:hypothetical protein